MSQEDLTRFGSPLSASGCLYGIRSLESIRLMHADNLRAALRAKGHAVTPSLERCIDWLTREEQRKFEVETKAKGVPEKFKVLFEIKGKSEAVRYCKHLDLYDEELCLLTWNSDQIGFSYSLKTKEFVPPQLEISDDDISSLKSGASGEAKRFSRKASAAFRDRKQVYAYLFERSNEWHCFYFSFRDIESEHNHWDGGPHLHYVSHLWPGLDKERLWQCFDERKAMIPGSLHVRYHPPQYGSGVG